MFKSIKTNYIQNVPCRNIQPPPGQQIQNTASQNGAAPRKDLNTRIKKIKTKSRITYNLKR